MSGEISTEAVPSRLSSAMSYASAETYSSQSPVNIRETRYANLRRNRNGEVRWVNEYKMIARLGKGSFAEVNLCEKQGPDNQTQRYAIKIFSKSLLRRKMSGFERRKGSTIIHTALEKVNEEIAIMKKLEHPNLVRLYEVIDDRQADTLYMVIEYVDAGPIMDYDRATTIFISRLTGGVLGESMASTAFAQIMSALAFLHLHHIAHRDLKPDNILVQLDGNIKIADFGVSHYFEEEESLAPRSLRELVRTKSRGITTKTEGTWSFWAPEMCAQDHAPFSAYAADVWAAGVCLWIFIFGSLPFQVETNDPEELYDCIRTHTPEFSHYVNQDLQHLLMGLLEKDPSKRISVIEAQTHPWTAQNYTSVDGATANARTPKVSVTPEDVQNAFSPITSIYMVSHVERTLKAKLRKARQTIEARRSQLKESGPSVKHRFSMDSPPVSPARSNYTGSGTGFNSAAPSSAGETDDEDDFFAPENQEKVAQRRQQATECLATDQDHSDSEPDAETPLSPSRRPVPPVRSCCTIL